MGFTRFLYEIYKQYNVVINAKPIHNYLHHQPNSPYFTAKLRDLLHSKYIAKFVKIPNDTSCNYYSLTFDKTKICVWFSNDYDSQPLEVEAVIIQFICMSVFFLNRFDTNNHERQFEILLIFSPEMKMIPNLQPIHSLKRQWDRDGNEIVNVPEWRPLSQNDVNTGVSQFGFDTTSSCIIYRKEEMLKTILHELIHCYNLDGSSIDSRDAVVEKKFGINNGKHGRIKATEATTDAIACLLRIAFQVLDSQPLGLYDFQMSYKSAVQKGVRHIKQVAQRVTNYMLREHKSKISPTIWIEETHVFSYYVLKSWIIHDVIQHLNRCFSGWKEKEKGRGSGSGRKEYEIYDVYGFLLKNPQLKLLTKNDTHINYSINMLPLF